MDRMQARHQDPDLLEGLFQIDHVITRMRRNAENLLVLAGEHRSRSWTEAVALYDVLRAAAQEVSDLDRIQYRTPGAEQVMVSGAFAVDLSHLVAELVENAQAFSPPSTPVILRTERSHGQLRLWIIDEGMGIDEDDLVAANDRLAAPGSVDAMATDRIGLHVVGRLARRLGCDVRLQPNPQGGTAAVVTIPDSLLEQRGERTTPPAPVAAPGRIDIDAEVPQHAATRPRLSGGGADTSGRSTAGRGLGGELLPTRQRPGFDDAEHVERHGGRDTEAEHAPQPVLSARRDIQRDRAEDARQDDHRGRHADLDDERTEDAADARSGAAAALRGAATAREQPTPVSGSVIRDADWATRRPSARRTPPCGPTRPRPRRRARRCPPDGPAPPEPPAPRRPCRHPRAARSPPHRATHPPPLLHGPSRPRPRLPPPSHPGTRSRAAARGEHRRDAPAHAVAAPPAHAAATPPAHAAATPPADAAADDDGLPRRTPVAPTAAAATPAAPRGFGSFDPTFGGGRPAPAGPAPASQAPAGPSPVGQTPTDHEPAAPSPCSPPEHPPRPRSSPPMPRASRRSAWAGWATVRPRPVMPPQPGGARRARRRAPRRRAPRRRARRRHACGIHPGGDRHDPIDHAWTDSASTAEVSPHAPPSDEPDVVSGHGDAAC